MTTAARIVSAFILSSQVGIIFATEQGAPAHVGNQCGERKQGESDVQQVDHVVLSVNAQFSLARREDHMIKLSPLRPHKEAVPTYKDFVKIRVTPRSEAFTMVARMIEREKKSLGLRLCAWQSEFEDGPAAAPIAVPERASLCCG